MMRVFRILLCSPILLCSLVNGQQISEQVEQEYIEQVKRDSLFLESSEFRSQIQFSYKFLNQIKRYKNERKFLKIQNYSNDWVSRNQEILNNYQNIHVHLNECEKADTSIGINNLSYEGFDSSVRKLHVTITLDCADKFDKPIFSIHQIFFNRIDNNELVSIMFKFEEREKNTLEEDVEGLPLPSFINKTINDK